MILHATARFTPRSDSGRFVSAVIAPGVEEGVLLAAERILATAQLIAPEKTGELRDSGKIAVERTDRTITASVVFDAPHAGYVEYGTGRRGEASAGAGPYSYNPNWPGMEARPFLRPALDEERGNVASDMAGKIALRLNQ
jgi:HK97 gp10 family phage protein